MQGKEFESNRSLYSRKIQIPMDVYNMQYHIWYPFTNRWKVRRDTNGISNKYIVCLNMITEYLWEAVKYQLSLR